MGTYRLDIFTVTAEPGKKYFDDRLEMSLKKLDF